jgi:hypothetical protein
VAINPLARNGSMLAVRRPRRSAEFSKERQQRSSQRPLQKLG